MEDLLYDVESVRRFVGLKLSEPMPDETTILHFRSSLGGTQAGRWPVRGDQPSSGVARASASGRDIVDASIMEAASSTKNRAGARDPEMHQVKKGNAWHFGMKVHIGVDAQTGVVHSVSTTGANVNDVTEAHRLLHGGESQVWGGCGVSGGPEAGGESGVRGGVAGGDAARPAPETGAGKPWGVGGEGQGVSVRAKVEHPFLYVKRHFGYSKVRYRGLAKNTQRLMALLGLTELDRQPSAAWRCDRGAVRPKPGEGPSIARSG